MAELKKGYSLTVDAIECPKCKEKFYQYAMKLKDGSYRIHCWSNECKHVWKYQPIRFEPYVDFASLTTRREQRAREEF